MAHHEQSKAPLRFDPRERIIERARHDNIAALPNTDEKLLRWYPYNNGWDMIHSVTEAKNRVKQRDRHLDMLSELGSIAIPKHTNFIGVDPVWEDEIVVYTFVDRIADLQPVIKKADIQHIYGTLLKYFSWVHDTEEPAIIFDFFKLDQFSINPNGPEGSPEITMFDLDPYIDDNTPANQATAREGLRQIQIIGQATTV